jgi:Ni,Fe-hydrogenase III large subunit
VVAPGGVHDDLTEEDRGALSEKLARAGKDVSVAVKLLWSTPSVLARFEETGVLTADQCRTLGLAGVPARACGLETDIRFNFPSGIYRFSQMPVSTWPSGDVFARAYVRWLEIQRSIAFILEQLRTCPPGPVRVEVKAPAADRFCVSLVEGWRGRICHVGITDSGGRFSRYKIVDPSFLNWTGLALAMRNQPVSDFPLCNKSFNLSYCGHDL